MSLSSLHNSPPFQVLLTVPALLRPLVNGLLLPLLSFLPPLFSVLVTSLSPSFGPFLLSCGCSELPPLWFVLSLLCHLPFQAHTCPTPHLTATSEVGSGGEGYFIVHESADEDGGGGGAPGSACTLPPSWPVSLGGLRQLPGVGNKRSSEGGATTPIAWSYKRVLNAASRGQGER